MLALVSTHKSLPPLPPNFPLERAPMHSILHIAAHTTPHPTTPTHQLVLLAANPTSVVLAQQVGGEASPTHAAPPTASAVARVAAAAEAPATGTAVCNDTSVIAKVTACAKTNQEFLRCVAAGVPGATQQCECVQDNAAMQVCVTPCIDEVYEALCETRWVPCECAIPQLVPHFPWHCGGRPRALPPHPILPSPPSSTACSAILPPTSL